MNTNPSICRASCKQDWSGTTSTVWLLDCSFVYFQLLEEVEMCFYLFNGTNKSALLNSRALAIINNNKRKKLDGKTPAVLDRWRTNRET